MRLCARAPGKVNLCLFLGEQRADGRHELVTVFESVSLADDLRLTTLADSSGRDEVVCPGIEEPNLVSVALERLRVRGWDAPPVRIEIVKRIPMAAGMAGGSADAAAALRLAVELAPGRPEEIVALAAALGADVPGQLTPGLSIGTGAGDTVETFEPIAPHAILVVPQPAHQLLTAEVYREADRLGLPRPGDELTARYEQLAGLLGSGPGAQLSQQLLVNDLEPAALSLCPAVGDALDAVRQSGADQTFVCGSGPTVAGLFWDPDGEARASLAARALGDRFPDAGCATPVGADFGFPVFA